MWQHALCYVQETFTLVLCVGGQLYSKSHKLSVKVEEVILETDWREAHLKMGQIKNSFSPDGSCHFKNCSFFSDRFGCNYIFNTIKRGVSGLFMSVWYCSSNSWSLLSPHSLRWQCSSSAKFVNAIMIRAVIFCPDHRQKPEVDWMYTSETHSASSLGEMTACRVFMFPASQLGRVCVYHPRLNFALIASSWSTHTYAHTHRLTPKRIC